MSPTTKKTPAFPSRRDQIRQLQDIIGHLNREAEESLYVVNALVWKLGLKNLGEARAVVDAYTTHMAARLAEQERERQEKAGVTVIENFINLKPKETHEQNPTPSSVAADQPPPEKEGDAAGQSQAPA